MRHVYVVTDYDPAREYDITKYAPDNVEYYKGLRIFMATAITCVRAS